MKALLVVVALLLIGIAGLGWYQGWFLVSSEGTGQTPNVTITLDKDKISADTEVAKDKVQGLGSTVEEDAGDLPETVEQ